MSALTRGRGAIDVDDTRGLDEIASRDCRVNLCDVRNRLAPHAAAVAEIIVRARAEFAVMTVRIPDRVD